MITHFARMAAVRGAAVLALVLATPGLHAAEVAGLRIDENIKVGSSELVLNGAGLRSKMFIKVYVGALYVTHKATSPAALLDAATSRRMSLRLLRDIDAETLYGALRDGLKDNNSEAELSALKAQIDQFSGIMQKIGQARSGDTVALDFSNDGVGVSVNGDVRGKVASAPFGRALLKVWLGQHPVDASLKKALLGS